MAAALIAPIMPCLYPRCRSRWRWRTTACGRCCRTCCTRASWTCFRPASPRSRSSAHPSPWCAWVRESCRPTMPSATALQPWIRGGQEAGSLPVLISCRSSDGRKCAADGLLHAACLLDNLRANSPRVTVLPACRLWIISAAWCPRSPKQRRLPPPRVATACSGGSSRRPAPLWVPPRRRLHLPADPCHRRAVQCRLHARALSRRDDARCIDFSNKHAPLRLHAAPTPAARTKSSSILPNFGPGLGWVVRSELHACLWYQYLVRRYTAIRRTLCIRISST